MSGRLIDGAGNVLGVLPLRIYIDGREDPVYEIREGGLEGGLRIIAPKADYEAHRNQQGGFGDSVNVDVSAGGDGTAAGGKRGAYIIQRDNGYFTGIGRGRTTRDWALEVRTYEDATKDYARFGIPLRLSKPYVYIRDGTGWRKVNL